MCSINDVDGNCENFMLTEKLSIRGNTICRSCQNEGLVVLRKKDVFCKNCFLVMATHKFRATLGKSKMMKPQDKVLVAYSGSQSSAALLHLLHSGVTEDHHKKLLFSVCVLFIDEGALFNKTVFEREEVVDEIKKRISTYDFPLFVSTLSDTFSPSLVFEPSLKADPEKDIQLVELFDNVRSISSKEDLQYVLRQQLILKAAAQLNCQKIFTAEVGTDLAVKLLSSFSLGRGDQASFETGFCDSRHPQSKILRPLRDFTKKEIVFYNNFHSLESISTPSLTTKAPSSVSIRKLTEKFVTDLQEGFPSTVYTIFRTGEKLSVDNKDMKSSACLCIICKDKIRTNSGKANYSAVEAADFSRNVSRKKSSGCGVGINGSCCGSCSGNNKNFRINETELEKFLCYGCTLIVRDMKNIDYLPKDILHSAMERRDLEAMKQQISEFLIDPSTELEV